MLVERTPKEIIVKLPANIDTQDLQDFLNFARYKELTANFSVGQEEVNKLSKEINAKWWSKNRSNLVK